MPEHQETQPQKTQKPQETQSIEIDTEKYESQLNLGKHLLEGMKFDSDDKMKQFVMDFLVPSEYQNLTASQVLMLKLQKEKQKIVVKLLASDECEIYYKTDHLSDEFIEKLKDILRHEGYRVSHIKGSPILVKCM